MDTFGGVGTATSLLVQAFHLFRHVSSARSFADSAGTLAALIAIEYFRFETWLQQSGLLVADSVTGEFVVSESSLRRAILLASDARSLTMDYGRVERHVLLVISQAHQCLLMLQELRDKYSLHNDASCVVSTVSPNSAAMKTSSEIPTAAPLFQNNQVAAGLKRNTKLHQHRAKTVSFFRKVNFTWSFKDDISDRTKVMEHVQTLKSCNDALLECLPITQQNTAERLVNMKALALSELPSDLKGLGNAASTFNDPMHRQIYQAMLIKARRVEESTQTVSRQELEQIELDRAGLSFQEEQLIDSRIVSQYTVANSLTTEKLNIILESVSFPSSLTEDDLGLLKDRIALLCILLRNAGHPYFPVLPVGIGFFQQSRTSFALAYQLPSFADQQELTCSLYSLLPRNKYSIQTEKSGRPNRFIPSLEQRYKLASALADGVLSLLSVNLMHKTITSRNIVVYRTSDTLKLDSPQLLGFGFARRERPDERSVDVRDEIPCPWRFWQHPELRSAGEEHRRFERRFDIFSLGVVLFEIGMWQDAHYYSSSASDSAVANADEFRRRLVKVCAQEMAHRMGEGYKSAVMTCLDGDEVWCEEAWNDARMDENTEENDTLNRGPDVTELFYLHVSSVLSSCCK
ncbi:hypothetical protein FPSE_07778 [Fusarium pseudograminearum CS3096]|uniref:Protein kinase domain-containing protein n=1 Tax=Fusarium pseudograminearum (strain CS3096) TaxID=1028729 RepID=K3UJA2_FUSPC|nr:hypothetical protein FPSE_07778 [Fusarium pseudograminearum CS3096]EKJ72036.1 hypothetical protein FPSE_07778 [Fusarium pseudograminearum CS3096]